MDTGAPGRGKAGPIILFACLAAWCLGPVAAAETDALPGITVTGSRTVSPESMSRPTNNVTVITAQDIARSTAKDLPTLLAAEANLSVQSFSGTEKNTTIDMRGMGDTAASNVLILVDGERLNETDQSGADLSTLSLSQIERIDVIRGGGGVRYGQGAVGGVINIITRRATPGPLQTDFLARAGSYHSRAVQAAARGGSERIAAQILLSHSVTDGYRDNGGLESNNAMLELRHVPDAKLGLVDLYARLKLHEDRYGLPGAVSQENFLKDDRARRSTVTPLDGGTTSDHLLSVGGTIDWGPGGKMSLRLSQRERRNPYVIGADKSTLEVARGLITADRHEAQWRYDLAREVGGLTQSLTLGIDTQDGRYSRWKGGMNVLNGERISGTAKTRSVFVDTNTSPVKGVNIHVGARQDWFTTAESRAMYESPCDYIDVVIGGRPIKEPVNCQPPLYQTKDVVPPRHWTNPSAELGAAWAFAPDWALFSSLSQHVRYPNLDDLAKQAESLRPQQGYTLEHGVRLGGNGRFTGSITVFVMRIEDEIYYGKDAQGQTENRNYDHPTLRTGLELASRWRASDRWSVRGQWAYVVPKFEHLPGDPDIPLVPRNNLSGELNWAARDDLQWSLLARHGSQRLDGNTLTNQSSTSPVVKANTVVDTALRLHRQGWQLSLGINNLFDEVYTTAAYSGDTYPMPGRSAYIEWRLSH
ncbi:TonB-dependent receptor [Aquabacterium sp.]|uniref:TonB-dependent receptor n=1 Tax=Aquabacterium sp. TaxID=1872578 RepID=UPI0019AF8B63|nr:TonB-dependent receptor [Aquabacterium sp.]MBC7700010.1 TonB-dependent receptor [Aquabacterium sp.]